MKYQALILSGAVLLTAAVTSTVAAVTYQRPQPTAIVQSTPTPQTPTEKLDPPPIAAPTPDTDFPHWRIELVDESAQSPDFAKFLDRVKQAVRDRDGKFIRSIVTPETKFSFGRHRSIDALNPDSPKSAFWTSLEKSLALGCSSDGDLFSCPTTFRQFDKALKNAPSTQPDAASAAIIVVGQGVNVRSQPNTTAPTIAALTNEIVQYDAETVQQASPTDRSITFSLENPDGWTPIKLPNNKRGYVSNRYVYSPLGYRAVFGKQNGTWMMQAFVTGD